MLRVKDSTTEICEQGIHSLGPECRKAHDRLSQNNAVNAEAKSGQHKSEEEPPNPPAKQGRLWGDCPEQKACF